MHTDPAHSEPYLERLLCYKWALKYQHATNLLSIHNHAIPYFIWFPNHFPDNIPLIFREVTHDISYCENKGQLCSLIINDKY